MTLRSYGRDWSQAATPLFLLSGKNFRHICCPCSPLVKSEELEHRQRYGDRAGGQEEWYQFPRMGKLLQEVLEVSWEVATQYREVSTSLSFLLS